MKYKGVSQFRKYTVPELLPCLSILLRGSAVRKYNYRQLILIIIVDVLQRLEGVATVPRIKELLGKFKVPQKFINQLCTENYIKNLGDRKHLRYIVDKKGSLVMRSYGEAHRIEIQRLMEVGITMSKL